MEKKLKFIFSLIEFNLLSWIALLSIVFIGKEDAFKYLPAAAIIGFGLSAILCHLAYYTIHKKSKK